MCLLVIALGLPCESHVVEDGLLGGSVLILMGNHESTFLGVASFDLGFGQVQLLGQRFA